MKLAAITHRYYAGSQAIVGTAYCRETLDEAIDRARELLAKDPRRDEVTIVKIVAVVRRAPLLVIVERFDDGDGVSA